MKHKLSISILTLLYFSAFTCVAVPKLHITTKSPLPSGMVAQPYTDTLTAIGGRTPYSWSVASGALPHGLSLTQPTGVIAGIPISAGTSKFAARVKDSSLPTPQTVTLNLSITIAPAPPPPLSCTATLPGGQVGVAYTGSINCTGGVTPYSYAISAGALPAGVVLDAALGTITGTPTASGTFAFSVAITDSSTGIVQHFAINVSIAAAD